MYSALSEPLLLRGLQLKNRIVFAPTTLGLRGQAYFDKLSEIARGGAALIIIGDVSAVSTPFGSLYDDEGFARYQNMTRLIHENGALACAQLHISDTDMSLMQACIEDFRAGKLSPDEMRELRNERVGAYITGLPAEQVHGMAQSFGQAAVLARTAGFDMVQIHGDRMLGSFCSTLFNSRTDSYGGSVQNRARMACEAVAAVRVACPDFPVEYKLAVRSGAYGRAGVDLKELSHVVPLLERAGVDCFHVALANHAALNDTIPPHDHPAFGAQGCFLTFCDSVRACTKLPVCAVGGLTDPDFINQQIASGRIAYAAMSRQLLADADWPRKAIEGRSADIRRCTRCNQCLRGMMNKTGARCILEEKS